VLSPEFKPQYGQKEKKLKTGKRKISPYSRKYLAINLVVNSSHPMCVIKLIFVKIRVYISKAGI
jgi:hypothetical protein